MSEYEAGQQPSASFLLCSHSGIKQAWNLHPSKQTTLRSLRPKSRTNKLRDWRGTNFSLRLKIKHPIRFALKAACSLVQRSCLCRRNVRLIGLLRRERVWGERQGEKFPLSFCPDRLNVQLGPDNGAVLSHAKMRYMERAAFCGRCSDFNWEAPKRDGIPSPPCLPLSLLYSFPPFLASFLHLASFPPSFLLFFNFGQVYLRITSSSAPHYLHAVPAFVL